MLDPSPQPQHLEPNQGSEEATESIPVVCFPYDDPILTVAEIAGWLRVKPSWVLAHASGRRRPYLPCFKAGRYPRFLKSEIIQFISELRQSRVRR